MYGIDVHILFPGNILSPGYIEENKVKPEITLKIEERDGGEVPEVVGENLIRGTHDFSEDQQRGETAGADLRVRSGIRVGMIAGKFHITYDFIGNVFRSSTRGSSPGNYSLLDHCYAIIGAVSSPVRSIVSFAQRYGVQVGLPDWRRSVDKKVLAHTDKHYDYLAAKTLVRE